MAEPQHKPRRSRRLLLAGAALAAFLILFAIGLSRFLASPGFNRWLRAKVIAQIEQVTGGRVELGSIHSKPLLLEFDLRDITIHGLEAPNELPYARADRLMIRAKILSLLGRKIGLRYLELERPAVHLIVYPDGTTNQPIPRPRVAKKSAIEQLFDIAVNRVEIKHGVLRLNDRVLPLDLAANNLAFTLKYNRRDQHYDAGLWAENIDTNYVGFKPPATSLDASFSLWRNHASLNWLNLASGDSRLRVRGEMDNFAQPRIDAIYDGDLDLRQLCSAARWRDIRGGHLTFNGQGRWSHAAFDTRGKLAIRDLDYANSSLKLVNAAIGSEYALSNDKLSFPHIFASALGGVVTGDATLTDWRKKPDATGLAHFQLRNFLLSRIASAVSTSGLPLERAHFAGKTSGTAEVKWKSSLSNAIVSLVLQLDPQPRLNAGDLAFTGGVRAAYDVAGQQLAVQELNLSTPATHIAAAGVLGGRSTSIRLSADSTRVGEWQPLIAALGNQKEMPLDVRGPAAFSGLVTGRLTAPTIRGHLQLADFDTLFAPSRRRLHWDELTTNLEYSPSWLAFHDAVLRRGGARLAFDFDAQLRNRKLAENSPFELQASVQNGSASELLSLAGYSYPITGTADFSVHVWGTQADPQGSGTLLIRNATVYGDPVERISSNIRFANHEAQFGNIAAVHNGASVRGSAGYNLTSGGFHFDLRGSRFNLARIRRLQTGRFNVAGTLDFNLSGSGTKDQPAINGSLQLRRVVVNGERVGDLDATAVTTGDTMRLTARNKPQNASLEIDGQLRLRGDYPAQFNLRFARLNVNPLLSGLLKAHLTAPSMAMGSISVQGPLRRPDTLNVYANIDELFAEVAHIQVRNSGPIRLSVWEKAFQIHQLHLLGNDTDMTVTGGAKFNGERLLNIDANGHVNLKLLQSVSPDLISYGNATAILRLRGTLTRPLIVGRVDITNGAVSYVDLPNGLSDINGRLTFNQDRLQVADLTARTGGGTLKIGGFVTYGQGTAFNLNASARDVRLRYPPGVSSMANAELHLSGSTQNALLSGDVTITRFGINPQFDFSSYLTQAKQATVSANTTSPLSRLRMDVHVVSTPELQVQTSLAKVSGNVDLRLRGTPVAPVVLGRVNIVEGEVSFNGTKYRVERGDITFTNPVRIEPVLDIQATTTVRSYDVTLGFHGPTSKLSTTYRSDPPLATADIVSLLAFGRTREETAQQSSNNQNLPETASYAILNQALNAAVSSRMQKIFGVSRIKIDPQAGGVETTTAGPTVTIEKQMANNLTITYISNISRANYQTIQMEYNVNRNVSIVATRDWNGVVSFDVKIRQRRK